MNGDGLDWYTQRLEAQRSDAIARSGSRDVTPIWKEPKADRKPRRPVKPIGKRSRLNDETWKANRAAVMDRAGGQCEFFVDTPSRHFTCTERATEVHHRVRQGGVHDVDLLVALCQPHHAWIHRNVAESYRRGWLVRRNAK